jgi:agmatinase
MDQLLNQLNQLLCPPGDGVYTVHTARDRKEKLWKSLYGKNDYRKSWQDSLAALRDTKSNNFILGICSDCGGGIQRGANWGPLFIRSAFYQDIKPNTLNDLGDIRVIPHLLDDKYLNEQTIKSCRAALYEDENSSLPVSPLSIAKYTADLIYEHFPQANIIGLGGDHSVSYPLVKSYLEHKKRTGVKAALIHFDAHTDLLTSRLGIDLCFGSWVPHILDDLETPDLCYQIGIRSSGKDKSHWEKEFGIQQFWAHEINDQGMESVAKSILSDLKAKGVQELYISFDIDALDESYASATGTPEAQGLAPHQCHLLINSLANEFKVSSSDLVEVAPFVQFPPSDPVGLQTTLMSANQTLQALVGATGKRD